VINAFSPFLAVRYLLTRRINMLAASGVMFAAWAMIVVNGVFSGFVGNIRDDVRRSTPDLLVTDLPHDTGYEQLRGAIEADDAVAATAPRRRPYRLLQPLRASRGGLITETSQIDFDHTESGFALLLGIDPRREERVTRLRDWVRDSTQYLNARHREGVESHALEDPSPDRASMLYVPDQVEWTARRRAGLPHGDPSQHRSSWPGVLLGWRRQPYMRWQQEGDPIDLLAAAVLATPDGEVQLRTHRVRLAFAGWFATGHRAFDELTAMLPIETLRTVLGHDIADPNSVDLVTDVAIRLRDGLGAADVIACQRRLQGAVQALLPTGSGPCGVLDWRQQNAVFLDAVSHEHVMMKFVLFVVLLLAAFVIYATLHMMVVQKWKDIGILSSLGGSPRDIGAVFLLCGFAVAATGALLGTGLGMLSLIGLNDINAWFHAHFEVELFPSRLFDLNLVPYRLEPSWIATVAFGSLALALVVAFVPARKAARMNPVTALSYE
jgi:ABC-type lipoprotein release transport system permease subunit